MDARPLETESNVLYLQFLMRCTIAYSIDNFEKDKLRCHREEILDTVVAKLSELIAEMVK